MNKTYYLEGYGCALNKGETEQISGFLNSVGFVKVLNPIGANYIIINTCSVKMVTEQRMLSRIEKLLEFKKLGAKIIVCGCLGATNPEEIKKINKELIVVDTKLQNLCKVLEIEQTSFSPKIISEKLNKEIAIIPISVGCLSNCTYCATKLARSKLGSYSIEDINSAFKKAIKNSSEIHITSQDLGCYGRDINTNLVELIKTLLKNEGEFRIRLGMISPQHFHKLRDELLILFKDPRIYKFLHLPVQSGSDVVLKNMQREYLAKEFIEEIEFIRGKIPQITIATDVIVGFPKETQIDFEKTLNLIKKLKPEVVNISRYGKRKGTVAAKMQGQILEKIKKERSKTLSELCRKQRLLKNKTFIGEKMKVLVSEKLKNNILRARNNSYVPVNIKNNSSKFITVKIIDALPNGLVGVEVK